MARTGRAGWKVRKVVDRKPVIVNGDKLETDTLECGHTVLAKWAGRGYDAPDVRRCYECGFEARSARIAKEVALDELDHD